MSRKRTRKRSSSTPKSNTDFDGIIDRITPIEDLPLIVTQMTYGRSGSGKTTYAASWPKPLLLLDVKDEGTDSVKDVEGIDVLSIETWDDFEQVYWYLKSGEHKFKSVCLDTITMLQDKCLEHVLDGREFATQQIWGQVSGIMKEWMINFRDLADDGINVHMIAQDRVTETDSEDDEESIDPEVGPRVMPSVAGSINAAMKVIGHSYIAETVKRSGGKLNKKVEYRLRIGPHPYYTTKIRKPKKVKAPEYIVNPTFDDVVAIMKGEVTAEKPKKSGAAKKRRPRTKK